MTSGILTPLKSSIDREAIERIKEFAKSLPRSGGFSVPIVPPEEIREDMMTEPSSEWFMKELDKL